MRSAGQGFLCGSKPLCATGDEHDGCAGCCEGLGDAQADPTGAAGYECMFAEKGRGGDDGSVEAWEEFQGGVGDPGNEKHDWFYWDTELLEKVCNDFCCRNLVPAVAGAQKVGWVRLKSRVSKVEPHFGEWRAGRRLPG